MEYSIGLLGGLGMAYGTLSSSWPVNDNVPEKRSNLLPILFLAVFIPFVLWDASFTTKKLNFLTDGGWHQQI